MRNVITNSENNYRLFHAASAAQMNEHPLKVVSLNRDTSSDTRLSKKLLS